MASGMKEAGKHASPADGRWLSAASVRFMHCDQTTAAPTDCYTHGLFYPPGGAWRQCRCGAACQAHNVGQTPERGGVTRRCVHSSFLPNSSEPPV